MIRGESVEWVQPWESSLASYSRGSPPIDASPCHIRLYETLPSAAKQFRVAFSLPAAAVKKGASFWLMRLLLLFLPLCVDSPLSSGWDRMFVVHGGLLWNGSLSHRFGTTRAKWDNKQKQIDRALITLQIVQTIRYLPAVYVPVISK